MTLRANEPERLTDDADAIEDGEPIDEDVESGLL